MSPIVVKCDDIRNHRLHFVVKVTIYESYIKFVKGLSQPTIIFSAYAVILHEQPDVGYTIIEKIERYTDVSFAVVLYTECDLGRDKNESPNTEKFRARQNVVFEHGYLLGKLGRSHVCALVKGNVETPGDISGVVYSQMDAGGAWKMQLGKNMKAAGLDVDLNKLCC